MKKVIIAGLMMVVGILGQAPTTTTTTTPTTPVTTCAANATPPFTYFALGGMTYDFYGQLPAVTTGFGIKTGACSNAFLVTNIDTAVGLNQGFATLREALEYHVAHSGNWAFIGKGMIGVTTAATATGTATSAMFAGGVEVSYDAGYVLSKKAFHMPVVAQFMYVAITANEVKPTYGLEFRKTF